MRDLTVFTLTSNEPQKRELYIFFKKCCAGMGVKVKLVQYSNSLDALFELFDYGPRYNLILMDKAAVPVSGESIYMSLKGASTPVCNRIYFIAASQSTETNTLTMGKKCLLHAPFDYPTFSRAFAPLILKSVASL